MAVVAAYDTKQGKRYRVRYRTPDNRQTDKRGFKTKRDAERFANTVEVAKLKGGEYVNPADARKTLDDLGEAWLERQKGHLKPSGYAVMETAWRVRVKPRWGGHVALGDIKPSVVGHWIAELGRASDEAKAIKPATIKRAHYVLAQILADAVTDNLIPKNPAAGLPLPKTARKRPVYLSHQQVDALADAAGANGALILTLAYTGLRWGGETIGLRISDLDLLRKRALIHENAVQSGTGIHVGSPKKAHKQRTVPLPEFLVPMLARLCENKSRADLLFGDGEHLRRPHPHLWMVRQSGRGIWGGTSGDSARPAPYSGIPGCQRGCQRQGGTTHARARQRGNDARPVRRPLRRRPRSCRYRPGPGAHGGHSF